MPETQAIYYRARDGSEPVCDFIDGLDERKQPTIDLQIDRLNGQPPSAAPLPFPHSSQVRGPLRELRCHYGPELYRVLYRRSGNLFVLLHMLRKDTGKIPGNDVAIAEQRWEDFKQRMDAPRRKPPRAAGHDAPKLVSQ
jgi:phage-related protein